jgi:hypothetical protein
MVETVKVGSRLTLDIAIPSTGMISYVITGVAHPTSDGMAVTEDVPADLFRAWLEDHADSEMVVNRQVFELPADFDAKPVPKEYGYEPALQRMAEDSEQRGLAEKGAPNDPEPTPATRAGLHVPVPPDLPEPPRFRVPEGAVPVTLNDGSARPPHIMRGTAAQRTDSLQLTPPTLAAPMDHPSAQDLAGTPSAPIPQINPDTPPVS